MFNIGGAWCLVVCCLNYDVMEFVNCECVRIFEKEKKVMFVEGGIEWTIFYKWCVLRGYDKLFS